MHRTLTLIALLLTACAPATQPPREQPAPLTELPRALSAGEAKIRDASNTFTFSLFRRLTDAQRGANVFVSPLSASMALGMTMNGAAGTTFDQMRDALGFGATSQSEINQGYKDLIALLRGLDNSVELRLANSIWYRSSFPFHQAFLAAAATWFDAEVQGLDFGNPTAVETINGWVDRSTNGKITQVIERISDENVMFLINAVYFKGSWRDQFDPSQTIDGQFHAADGRAQPVKLMHRNASMRYHETAEFQAVDLSYGRDAFAMTVLLPKPGTTVDALATSLTTDSWAKLVGRFHTAHVDLHLPRLKLTYERTLNDDLKALGIRDAFVPDGANFTGMSPQGLHLFIDYVKQKTYVDINEEGTEAAAVTVVGISVTSAPQTAVMRVDRPYLFAIRERLSGTILFIGKIAAMPS